MDDSREAGNWPGDGEGDVDADVSHNRDLVSHRRALVGQVSPEQRRQRAPGILTNTLCALDLDRGRRLQQCNQQIRGIHLELPGQRS